MCSISNEEDMIAVGQAGGYVDIIVQPERGNKYKNSSYIHVIEAGYINKVIMSSKNEIIMACEKGGFISDFEKDTLKIIKPKEFYLD